MSVVVHAISLSVLNQRAPVSLVGGKEVSFGRCRGAVKVFHHPFRYPFGARDGNRIAKHLVPGRVAESFCVAVWESLQAFAFCRGQAAYLHCCGDRAMTAASDVAVVVV